MAAGLEDRFHVDLEERAEGRVRGFFQGFRPLADPGVVDQDIERAVALQRAIVPSLDHALFAKALNALEQCLGAAGYGLILASHNFDPDHERRQIENLLSRRIDALVLVGAERDAATYALLEDKAVPYVSTWIVDPENRRPGVGFDNFAAGHRIASYLLELGHRDLAMISAATEHNDRARQRQAGVRRALAERDLVLLPERVVERPFGHLEGQHGFKYLMGLPDPPTAIVCGADIFAVGAVLQAGKLGIRVPQQVSITGFDDIDLAALVDPPLTCVSAPIAEMGFRAGEYLLERLKGNTVPPTTLLDVEIVLRQSTAPPPR
jgi:LacI family transcriptional regulator